MLFGPISFSRKKQTNLQLQKICSTLQAKTKGNQNLLTALKKENVTRQLKRKSESCSNDFSAEKCYEANFTTVKRSKSSKNQSLLLTKDMQSSKSFTERENCKKIKILKRTLDLGQMQSSCMFFC
ncbi:hypothetical protein ACJMK2_032127 [Sinanodonta woodiana]|uniref:Uncharacterized protein n=1 Tax=Sinanodonta woodiana TaxID=1069815 RepID=A0ABD3X4D6_SINWO